MHHSKFVDLRAHGTLGTFAWTHHSCRGSLIVSCRGGTSCRRWVSVWDLGTPGASENNCPTGSSLAKTTCQTCHTVLGSYTCTPRQLGAVSGLECTPATARGGGNWPWGRQLRVGVQGTPRAAIQQT
eukprot:1547114-Prymnesium_polylepis.3